MVLETLMTESIHFIKEAKLPVEQTCPVYIWSLLTCMVLQVGQKGKTIVAATEVTWSLVMDQGPVRLLGMLLLWWGDTTCALDLACDLGALGFRLPQYSCFRPVRAYWVVGGEAEGMHFRTAFFPWDWDIWFSSRVLCFLHFLCFLE